MTEFTTWRSLVDGKEIIAIPDNLTEYELTDPDGRISVIDANSYSADFEGGRNDSGRLFTDYDFESVDFEFDVTVNSSDNQGRTYIGFSDTEDVDYFDMSNFVGLMIGDDDGTISFEGVSGVSSETIGDFEGVFATTSTEQSNSVKFSLDETGSLTLTVTDSDDNEIGSDTITFDDTVEFAYLYAAAAEGRGGDVTVEGNINYDITRWLS